MWQTLLVIYLLGVALTLVFSVVGLVNRIKQIHLLYCVSKRTVFFSLTWSDVFLELLAVVFWPLAYVLIVYNQYMSIYK